MRSNEDIVKALGICSTINGAGPECADCPYWPVRGTGCMNALMNDAHGALEPYVMTLEQVTLTDRPVFFESQDCLSWVFLQNVGKHFIGIVLANQVDSITPQMEAYGITWRCWTDEPTYEQRKDVRWDRCESN